MIKFNAVERGTTSATWLYQHNQSVHVTDGMTVTSLSESLQYKTSVAIGSSMPNCDKPKIIA
jgi:hypothetical protein